MIACGINGLRPQAGPPIYSSADFSSGLEPGAQSVPFKQPGGGCRTLEVSIMDAINISAICFILAILRVAYLIRQVLSERAAQERLSQTCCAECQQKLLTQWEP
jgi:hypothetical protein